MIYIPPRIRTSTPERRYRRGTTLLELLVSITVSSILLVGLSSSTYLALKAADVDVGPFYEANEGCKALFELTRELQYAVVLNETANSATLIEFTISDITSDATAETIRYEWSGIPGDPLQRSFNGSPVKTVIANVHMFKLTYHTRMAQDNAGQDAYFNTGVTITVQIGSDSASQIQTTVRTFNEPEASYP
jgi:prepilin-type N-terminal cleavage/methylation domain-containing protein